MKNFLQKNLIHPSLQQDKDERSSPVPIISIIPNQREDPNDDYHSIVGPLVETDTFILRRHYRNSENEPETWKYEVLSNSGRLIYYISEKTEFFVKDTGCLFQPHCREFSVTSTSCDPIFKFVVEFGRTGFCNKISIIQQKRRLGSVQRKCSVIPNSYNYSILNSYNNEIMSLRSKHCLKSNLLCISKCQKFDIRFGKDRYPRGSVSRDCIGYLTSLTHGTEPVKKLLLISSLVLLDLQTTSRRKGVFQCDLGTCLFQLVASICFYIFMFVFVVGLFYAFIIQ